MPTIGVPFGLRTGLSKRAEGNSLAARCGTRGGGGRFGAVSNTGKGGGVRLITGTDGGATGAADEPSPPTGFSGNAPTKNPGSAIGASADLSFNLPPWGASAFRDGLTSGTAGSLVDGGGMTASEIVGEVAARGAGRIGDAVNATGGA